MDNYKNIFPMRLSLYYFLFSTFKHPVSHTAADCNLRLRSHMRFFYPSIVALWLLSKMQTIKKRNVLLFWFIVLINQV